MVHVHGNSLGLASLSSNIFLCKRIIQFEANIPKGGGEQSYVPVFKPKTWGSRPTNVTSSITSAKPGALGFLGSVLKFPNFSKAKNKVLKNLVL